MALNALSDVIEFSEAVRRVTSHGELDRLFWDRYSGVGAHVGGVAQIGAAGHKLTMGRVSNAAPKHWIDIYRRRSFVKKDLAARHAFTTTTPFTWADIEKRAAATDDEPALEVFRAAREISIGAGFVVPAHSADGTLAVVTFYGDRLSDDPQDQAMMHLVGLYYQIAFDRLNTEEQSPLELDLTHRQLECLKWVSEGKSDWEIGEILGISEATVNRHVERAKRRLNVHTRAHAVAAALQRGVLAP